MNKKNLIIQAVGLGLLALPLPTPTLTADAAEPRVPITDPAPCEGLGSGTDTLASWQSLLMALERGCRPGLDELPQLAAALADAPKEVLIVWDQQGQFLFDALGDTHSVWIPRDRVRELEGSVMLHNHPSGLPHSPRDLETVLCYGLQRSYVATRVNDEISLTGVGWAEAATQQATHDRLGCRPPRSRRVIKTAPALATERTAVVAAQIADTLLGASL